MNKNVFFKVVVPLLEVSGTALICISTPLKKANFYSELCELKDQTGELVFNVKMITLNCEKCAALKYKKGESTKVCKHVLNRLPPWKDSEKHEVIKMMYEQVGRGGDYDRESRGMIRDDGDVAFQSEWIDRLRDNRPYRAKHTPTWILCTCDPNMGGHGSDTAFLSSYYYKNQMIICGVDSHPSQRDEKKTLAISHIKALRNIDRFKRAWIIFVIENNLDDAANKIVKAIKYMDRVHIYIDDKLKEGKRTTKWSKILYTEKAEEYLSQNAVYFDAELVSGNPYKPSDQRVAATRAELIRQLRFWKKLYFINESAKTDPYVTCSGKTVISTRSFF